MSLNSNQPANSDPVSAFLTSKGILRLVILALGVSALIFPVYQGEWPGLPGGLVGNFGGRIFKGTVTLTQTAPWVIVLPAAALCALIGPAVPPLARYARWLDTGVAVIGCIVGAYLAVDLIRISNDLAEFLRLNPSADWMRISIGIGTYLLVATIALAIVQAFRRG